MTVADYTSHVTSVVLAVDPEGDTRYRPRCTCGWEGALVTDQMHAKSAAFVHREGARIAPTDLKNP